MEQSQCMSMNQFGVSARCCSSDLCNSWTELNAAELSFSFSFFFGFFKTNTNLRWKGSFGRLILRLFFWFCKLPKCGILIFLFPNKKSKLDMTLWSAPPPTKKVFNDTFLLYLRITKARRRCDMTEIAQVIDLCGSYVATTLFPRICFDALMKKSRYSSKDAWTPLPAAWWTMTAPLRARRAALTCATGSVRIVRPSIFHRFYPKTSSRSLPRWK